MRIGLVKGRSIVSGPIKYETRSVYSHSNLLFDDGAVFEAEIGGFDRFDSLSANNSGCLVDLFEYDDPLSAAEIKQARDLCESLRGRAYDLPMVIAFLQRLNYEPPSSRNKLDCSEAVMIVTMWLGENRVLLRNIEPWAVSPGMIRLSTRIHWVRSINVP